VKDQSNLVIASSPRNLFT